MDLKLDERPTVNAVSPGVRRIEVVNESLAPTDRVWLFFSVFLLAYAYGLDGQTRYVYQTYATNSFETHSELATINVVRTVIAAAAQPPAAKLSDIIGRSELLGLSVLFYVVGTILQAAAGNVATFAGGAVLYQLGYTLVQLLIEVIIGDLTSLRSRVFFSYIPALPFIINTWISGNVTSAVLAVTTWRWGIGMWALIYPVCALPLISCLIWTEYKAGVFKTKYTRQEGSYWKASCNLFWLIDAPGIILVIAVFALILVPLTIAGGVREQWKSAKVIAPLCVGFVCIPFWVLWELLAPHPLIPFRLLKGRASWVPLGIACLLNFAWAMQGDYLYTILMVGFDMTTLSATRVSSLYSFASVITGPIVGLVIWKVKVIKPFLIFGICLFMTALGLLIKYRGETTSKSGVIGAQVLLGVGGGMFPYPAQAVMQAYVPHERLAVVTSLYLATYQIGSALGNSVSGAVWTQILPSQLSRHMPGNASLAASAYAEPLTVILQYPWGTPERTAMVHAWSYVQWILCIIGVCLAVPLLVLGLISPNPRLISRQSLAESAESDVKNAVANPMDNTDSVERGDIEAGLAPSDTCRSQDKLTGNWSAIKSWFL